MTIYNDYQSWTNTTLADSLAQNHSILLNYLVLGLASEASEVLACVYYQRLPKEGDYEISDDFAKEAGDICWYVAQLCEYFDFTFEAVVNESIGILESSNCVRSRNPLGDALVIISTSAKNCDLQKKVIRDTNGYWTPDKLSQFINSTVNLMSALIRLIHTSGASLEMILEINQGKLNDRVERGVIAGSGDNR